MSKVTSPFFGFHASQQINKSLVYFVWKGLNVVRSWVSPANPNTAAQQTVRNNFHAIIDMWHNALMNLADHTAWDRAATAMKSKPQSGFNRFIGVCRAIYEATANVIYLNTYTNIAKTHNAFSFSVDTTAWIAGDSCVVYWGDSLTSMWRSTTGVHALGTWTFGPFDTTFAAGVKVFFRCDQKDAAANVTGSTGIYTEVLT